MYCRSAGARLVASPRIHRRTAWMVGPMVDSCLCWRAQRRIRHLHNSCDRRDETTAHHAKGLDDGPEYSPDGRGFTSTPNAPPYAESGACTRGSEQEQVFRRPEQLVPAHFARRQWMVFLTYGADVTGHPENKDVMLRSCRCQIRKLRFWQNYSEGREPSTFPHGRPTANS